MNASVKFRWLPFLTALAFCASSALAQTSRPAQKTPPKKSAPAEPREESLAAQAEQAIEKKEYQRAAELLRRYLADHPSDSVAHFQLGYAATALSRKAEARAAYEKAAELDPKLAAAHLNLGLLLLDEAPAVAVEPLRRAAELQPGRAQPRFLLGQALERSGKLSDAIAAYQAAAEIAPDNSDTRFALARAQLASGAAADAEANFRRALETRADFAPARAGLAESLIAQDKLEPAAAELEAYLAALPDDTESRFQLASLYFDLGRYDAALPQLDKIPATPAHAARVESLRGEALIRLRRLDEAASAFERATQAAPREAALYARLGRVRLEQRDFPAAERALQAALALDAKLTDAWRDLTSVYYLAEKYAQALRALELLGQRETLAPGSWFIRATCYDKLGMKPEALAAYERFLALDQGRNETQDFQARQRVRLLSRELKRNR